MLRRTLKNLSIRSARRLPNESAVAGILLYKRMVSPLFPPACRFYPSCSEYSIEVFRKHGFFKALLLSVWRILRCNPFNRGGFDPAR